MIRTTIISTILRENGNILSNKFHTTCTAQLDQKWRRMKGLTLNPNKFGPLTNLSDYTFKDGRPTPLGTQQYARLERHREYAKRVIQLVAEIDHAVEKHANVLKQQQQERQKILDSKLKPKGNKLIESA